MVNNDYKVLPQVLVAFAAFGGTLNYGILVGWSSPAALFLFSEDNKFHVSTNQFSYIAASMAIGAAFSCVLSGIIRSKFGTRYTILVFGLPITIGWVLITIAINPAMLMVGRFLCGIAAGCYCFILPIYVGEISSAKIRGTVLSIFQITLNIGILLVYLVGHFTNLLTVNIMCGSIAVLFTFGFLVLPESPVLLISKNREDEANKSLKLLRGKFYNTDSEIEGIKNRHKDLEDQKKSFIEVFQTKATVKAFIIILMQFFFLQASGLQGVLSYSNIIFTEAGLSIEPGIASIMVASVQVGSTLITTGVVDYFGRKVMLYFSNSFNILALVGIGTYFTLKDAEVNVDSIRWLPVASLCTFVFAFSLGLGAVTYILLGELFLQDAKAYVAPITQIVSFVMNAVVNLTFPTMTAGIGTGPTFYIFAGFCTLALLWAIFVVPETKGKTSSEIQKLLE